MWTWIIVGAAALLYAVVLRPRMLRWGVSPAEAAAAMPGDDLVGRPGFRSDQGALLPVPPTDVWPWLVQMGQDRAGFYSLSLLENLLGARVQNAEAVHPEWQHLAVGDGVRFHPRIPPLPVAALDPERTLVIGSVASETRGPYAAASWSFYLTPAPGGRTRLVTRMRLQWPKHHAWWAVPFPLAGDGTR